MKKTRYRSENRYKEFLSAAKEIAGKISRIRGVVGILATGGIGRGHCDYYSDLDLIVYADDRVVSELDKYIAVGGLRYKGIELDTPVESYQKASRHKVPSRYWSQVMRWDRESSLILFDTHDRIKNLLKEKLIFPAWEEKKLLKRHSRGVAEHLIYNFELWEKRGSTVNLSHGLLQGTEHLILWIYAKNKRFQPYLPKWLFYHLENGFVPESRYFRIIKKAYISPIRTLSDARKTRKELLSLCDRAGLELAYRSVDDFFEHDKKNWERASEKTRYYLSW